MEVPVMKKWFVLSGLLLMMGLPHAVAQQRPLFLNMGTTATSSGHYPYWVAVSQSIEQGSDNQIFVNVLETGSSIDNLRRMGRGEIEFGLVTAEAAGQAYLGLGVFEDEDPWEEVRTLWYYVATPNIFIVRADAGVQSFQDLDGRQFNPGIPGSSTESIAMAIFETLEVQPVLHRGATADAMAATQDRQIVGFAKSAASATVPDASFVELRTFTDVQVVGLTEEQVGLVTELFPYFVPVTVPAGVYPDQDEPYHTIAVVPGAVSTSELLSEQDAYDIVKAVFENKQLQEEAFGGVADVDFAELTIDLSIAPLHAGVVRYFRELGVEIPDHLLPPEAQ
jgi:TRAP transporter TAXI family solute receptor